MKVNLLLSSIFCFVAFTVLGQQSDYCSTPTLHFAGDAGSEILLTIENTSTSTMQVTAESTDADAVDVLIVSGGTGAAISTAEETAPGSGVYFVTLTWTGTPPTDVLLNVLWSKESFGGNWQLSTNDVSIPFDATCPVSVPCDLLITGVFDGPLSGGVPKAIEFYVIEDIADLSLFGFGSANNGGGSDGQEFTFPAVSATAGDFIHVASESVSFNDYFGFAPDYTSSAASINGDDAIELFYNGDVIDLYGVIDVDGSGEDWDYLDGWAYRNSSVSCPSATFDIEEWTVSGINVNDGQSSNSTAVTPWPIETYSPPVPTPTTSAPTPDCDPADVISMFSDAYEDVPVDTWLTPWSNATGGDIVLIDGNEARLYENVDFLGIETVSNQIDASGMTDFHIDVWTPNMTTFRVKLVNFGPGGNSESEIAFTPVLDGWNTYVIPMADFTGLTGTSNIAQLILSGLPVGEGTLYIDNVYFSNANCPVLAMPAAPTPDCDPADVISMFSDAYEDVPVDTWLTPWSNATGGDIVLIDGNEARLYENVDFLGIETVSNQIDASGMTDFHIDVWTPNMTTFRVKLVNFGPGGNSESEIAFTPVLDGWNTYVIPMADFTGLTGTSNIAQLILSGLPVGEGTLYIDNVYFSNANCPVLAMPAAPTPDCDPADVISMFSDAYEDVPVDTWLTPWSNATGGDIVLIDGNEARLYENVDFLGIETVSNQIDASGMTDFHIDVWTPNMTTFRVKLVNFGPGGNSESEIAFTPVLDGWNTYVIPMADFTGLTGTSNIAQLILSGLPVGEGTLYIDNVYFSNANCPVLAMPAAPTPDCDPADVISMFSDAYEDVPVDTWLTPWSNATGGDIVLIDGNEARLYENVGNTVYR